MLAIDSDLAKLSKYSINSKRYVSRYLDRDCAKGMENQFISADSRNMRAVIR